MRFSRKFCSSLTITALILGSFNFIPKTQAAAPTNGLVGYWNFDGGTATDTSGSGNNGTLTNSPTPVSGHVGSGGMSFGGTNYVTVPDASSLTGSSGLTISFWINTNETASRTVLSKRHGSSPYYSYNVIIDTLTNNRANCTIMNNSALGGTAGGATSSFTRGVWQHITCVYNGSSVAIYTNGAQSGFTSSLTGTVFDSDGTLQMPVSNSPFVGSLDEVRIYNRALSAQEILDVYNDTGSGGGSPSPSPTPPPPGPTDTTAPVVSSISSSSITTTSATVSWNTDEVSDSQVDYGPTTGYGSQTTLSSSLVTNHSQSLSGLTSGTLYHYRVRSRDSSGNQAVSPDNTFTTTAVTLPPPTPPPPSAPSTAVIPDNRRINWGSSVGVPGGIPNRTTICSTINAATYGNGTTDAAPAINAAISACPANQVVYLPAGTYLLNSVITLTSNITLRGAGPGATIIRPPAGSVRAIQSNTSGTTLSSARSILSGSTKGSTSITVSDASGIQVGSLLDIYQANDPDFYWSRWQPEARVDDQTGQFVIVTAVNGTTISFQDPLVWDFTLNPRLKYWNGGMRFGGVENLTISADAANGARELVLFSRSYASWIKNVETVGGDNNSHIALMAALRTEIRDSYIHDSYSTADGYGIQTFFNNQPYGRGGSTGALIENNVFSGLRVGLMLETEVGSVLSYNFFRNIRFVSWTTNQVYSINANHGHQGMMQLYEGNVGTGMENDGYHGSTGHLTIYRNRFHGQHVDPNRVNNVITLSLNRYSYYHNVMGNVLGFSGWPGSGLYEMTASGHSPSIPVIYRFGYPNLGNNNYSATNPPSDASNGGYDPKVKATLLLSGNYDYDHTCTWDDAAARCLNSGEVAALGLPASLYLSSKPAWFGNLAWPPIGPDVSGLATVIPAEQCYNQGLMPNCLSGSASPTTPPPPPPVTPPPPAPDTTNPTVSITSPLAGATVSGTSVTISASASDPVISGQTTSGISKVSFQIDSGTAQEDSTSPYSAAWNTTLFPNGNHTITVVATDSSNNTVQSQITVNVNNLAVSPAPTPSPSPSPTPSPTPTPSPAPTSTPPALAVIPDAPGTNLKLINSSGTYYLIIDGIRHGITNPGLLTSYGFTFEMGKIATPADLALPEGELLLPSDGILAKTAGDPTVWLISENLKRGFTSANVFTSLGFNFNQVLVITDPELNKLGRGVNLNDPYERHPEGVDINQDGIVYWIQGGQKHPYPSLDSYNSWRVPNDFSRVLPANAADRALPVGSMVGLRVLE
jgi:hypothetical protein